MADGWPPRNTAPRPEVPGPTLNPAQMPHQGLTSDLLPRPPKEGEHLQSGKLLLEHLGVFSLPSFSRPQMPIFFPCPPSMTSWGKKQMGFSRKAAECLLHLPFPALPLRTKCCSCHGNGAGLTCCSLQATDTAPGQYQDGWSGFGSCSLDANGTRLAYASWTLRCAPGVEGSKPGHPILFPTPTPRVLLLPRRQGSQVFAPAVSERALQRAHSLSSPLPTHRQDSTAAWG